MFKSPKRRATRQRSGYKVSGDKSGSEAKIITARAYKISSRTAQFEFERNDAELVPQFESGVGVAAIGGYIKTELDAEIQASILVVNPLDNSSIVEKERKFQVEGNKWNKFGLYVEIKDPGIYELVTLMGIIKLKSSDKSQLGKVQFLGVNLDTVTEYESKTVKENFGNNVLETLKQKTFLYYPEIFYWEQEHDFLIEPTRIDGKISQKSKGEQIVVKACNRCARFLPIDVINERQSLGFSNHCVQRAPCTHNAFSRFTITNWKDVGKLDKRLEEVIGKNGDKFLVKVKYGYQLECRPCKKFKVNAPLNPLRNAAQRREDGLRRRAFERLIRHLLKIDWVFYKHRREKRKDEFDTHIWKKFGKKCFACGKELPHISDMELDHTMPLAYLWPLDETATCLCATCNSQKHDRFPFEFSPYKKPGRLKELADLTGVDKSVILSEKKMANPKVVEELRKQIVWFFDNFLSDKNYQKIRKGKKAADLIVRSLQKILNESNAQLNLVDEYRKKTKSFPKTITKK